MVRASRFSVDTTIVRCVAVLLVVNSHLEGFYPYAFLADGGLIGLTLFFAASGFGLACSPRLANQSFAAWIWRRLKRIYPSILVTVLLLSVVANGNWQLWGLTDYCYQFLYPTQYHFIAKILVYYVVLYGLWQLPTWMNRWIVAPLLVTGLGISVWSDVQMLYQHPVPLRTGSLAPTFLWLVFLATLLWGAVMATYAKNTPPTDETQAVENRRQDGERSLATAPIRPSDWVWLTVLFAGYLISKFMMAKLGLYPWLFPLYFAIGVLFSFQLFRVLTRPSIIGAVRRRPWLWSGVAMLSAISLESYLVHSQMVHWAIWQRVAFPGNIIVFVAASIAIAYLFHGLAKRLQEVLP